MPDLINMINKDKKPNKLTDTEKAYIAGFLDADGCVGISRNKSMSKAHNYDYVVRIMIINCDFKFIEWLKEKTGIGTAYCSKKAFKANWRPVHRWQATANKAKMLLEELSPYMIVKKYRAELCLKMPHQGHLGRQRSQEDYNRQEELFYELKSLNKRGVQI